MKINRLFVLAMAVLAFAACNKQENSANIEGTGAVTIRISSPEMTKSVDDALKDGISTVKVTGDVVITLTAEKGGGTIKLNASELAEQSNVTFWNVKDPQIVTVSMNGGQSSYAGVAPTAFAGIAPQSIPAYGETSTFTLTADTSSPDPTDKTYESGAGTGDENKVYQLYTASVKLAIPVARLEVSGIKHVHDTDASCAYSVLNIAGVYLDNVYATGEGVTYSNGRFPCASGTPADYCFDEAKGTGNEAILKDTATVTNFLTPDAVWPEDGKAYSYYFYGANEADNMPKFKIYFNESEAIDSSHPLPAPRYAMITSYQNSEGATINSFDPGKIYRITKAELKDKNVVGDESGNTMYGVVVTVEEASWTVETISGVWAE